MLSNENPIGLFFEHT